MSDDRATVGLEEQGVAEACLQALQNIGAAVTTMPERQALLDLIVKRAAAALGADGATLRLLDPSRTWLTLMAHDNIDSMLAEQTVRVKLHGSATGEAMAARRPIFVENLCERRAELAQTGFCSALISPLLIRGTAVGSLTFYWRRRHACSSGELAAASVLAGAAALALEHARLSDESRQRLGQTDTLLSVAQIVCSSLGVSEVTRRATRELVLALGADVGGAWLLGPDRSHFMPVTGYRVPKELLPALTETPVFFAHPLIDEIIVRKQAVCSAHSQVDPLFDHPLLKLLPHRAVMAAPMWLNGEIIGIFVLVWTRDTRSFRPEELRMVEGIAQVAAVAIDNARLVEAERESRRRLEASEARYRTLFENVDDAVYLHDLEGRILAINPAAESTTGYSLDELHRMNVDELVAPEHRDLNARLVDRLVRGESPTGVAEIEILRRDGRRAVLECSARAVLRDGVPVAVQGIGRDVTVRRQLEQRQQAFAEIVKELAAEDDLDRLLALIEARACALMDVESSIIGLVEPDGIAVRGARGLARELEDPSTVQDLLERVAKTGAPVVATDMETASPWRATPLVTASGYRAMLQVPIRLRGEVTGVLCVLHRAPREFIADDVALLSALADHTAIALDRARLAKSVRLRLRETETLLRVGQTVGATLDPVEGMRRVAREVCRVLGADMVGAYVPDADHSLLRPIAGYRVPKELVAAFTKRPIPLRGHGPLQTAWWRQKPIWSSDVAHLSGIDPMITGDMPHRSHLFVPMVVKGEPVGALLIVWWERSRKLAPEEVRLVEGIAGQAAMAIDHARLYRQTHESKEEIEALAGIARELAQTLNLDQVLGLALQQTMFLTGAAAAYVALAGDDGTARVVNSAGLRSTGQRPIVVRRGEGLAGRAFATGEMQACDDYRTELEQGDLDEADAERIGGVLVVPLKVRGRTVGLLWLGRREAGHFGEIANARVMTLSLSLSIAIDNARLYDQLARRNEELRGTNEALTDSLQARSNFLANISHEIRSPLNSVLGLLQLVLDALYESEEERRAFVAEAYANARHLLTLLDDVLDTAKLETGRLEVSVEPVDLAAFLDELYGLVRYQAETKGLALTVAAPTGDRRFVLADPDRLRQVLLNVLGNSLKFTERGAVRLTAAASREHGVMTIAVVDTGIGVAPADQPRLFQHFVQADAGTARKYGGTGLGLAVSKNLVALMGGAIRLESAGVGQGTTVTITLPLAAARPAAPTR